MISNEEIHAELVLVKDLFNSVLARLDAIEAEAAGLVHQTSRKDPVTEKTKEILCGEFAIGEESDTSMQREARKGRMKVSENGELLLAFRPKLAEHAISKGYADNLYNSLRDEIAKRL